MQRFMDSNIPPLQIQRQRHVTAFNGIVRDLPSRLPSLLWHYSCMTGDLSTPAISEAFFILYYISYIR